MTRKLKRLAIALSAISLLSVAFASAAHALPEYTTGSGEYPRSLSGSQVAEHKITAGSNTVTCKTVNYTGTVEKKSSEQVLTPEYKECSTTTGKPATITFTKHINITPTGEFTIFGVPFWVAHFKITTDMVIHIYCCHSAHTENKSICTITFGEQVAEGVTLQNSENGVLAKFESEPAVSIEGSVANCGTGKTATYTGSSLIKAAGDIYHVGGV